MTTLLTRVERYQDQYVNLTKRIEEPVVRFAGDLATRVARFVPARPQFMAALPSFPALVENSLTFRKRNFDQRAAFTRKVVKALEPVFVKSGSVSAKPVVKVAPSTVTRMSGRTTKRAAKPAAKRTVA